MTVRVPLLLFDSPFKISWLSITHKLLISARHFQTSSSCKEAENNLVMIPSKLCLSSNYERAKNQGKFKQRNPWKLRCLITIYSRGTFHPFISNNFQSKNVPLIAVNFLVGKTKIIVTYAVHRCIYVFKGIYAYPCDWQIYMALNLKYV